MSNIRLASRYAKSLIDLAIEKAQLEAIYADVKLLDTTLENSAELRTLLKSPIINAGKKQDILDAIFKAKLNTITHEFITILVRKGREPYLADITSAFISQYNKHNNITAISLTTAEATDQATVDAIIEKVKAVTNIDKVELTTAVDAELIGGFVLKFEDKLFDASIARQLEVLKKEYRENKFEKAF